jgi:hypothetical protein
MAMYALPTDPSELKAFTSRTQRAGTQQHASIADIAGANFAKGDIVFPFLVSGNRWWIPAKSYLRGRFQIMKGDGSALGPDSPIGPTMGMFASLFQSAEFLIRGVPVSRITDFVPQIDQYVKRTTSSDAFMKNALDSMDYQSASFKTRRNNWNIGPEDQGLVQTHEFNGANFLGGVGIPAYGKMDIQLSPPPGAGGPGFFEITNTALAPGEVGWDLGNDNMFQPGDRITFYGGVGANPENLSWEATVHSKRPLAAGGGWYILFSPASVVVASTPIGAAENFIVHRDVAVEMQQIDATTFELCWQPPLSVFGLSHALPSMSCELKLKGRPGNRYGLAAINTQPALNGAPAGPTVNVVPFDQIAAANAAAYCLKVESMYFYTYQVESDRMTDGTFLLDLEECICSSQQLDSSVGLNQKSFLVPPSTYQIGVALQDNSAGITTDKSISYFGYENAGPDGVISSHKDLSRMFLQYSNMTFPQPDADPLYNMYPIQTGVLGIMQNQYTQRWIESSMGSGQFWTPGGPENIQDWWDKGPLHVFPTLRAPDDKSTNVVSNMYFNRAPRNAAMLLFAMSRKVAIVSVTNGSVNQVSVNDQ